MPPGHTYLECHQGPAALLEFHLAARGPIETISPGISWDQRCSSFSYRWEKKQWRVHVRTGVDCFHFWAVEKERKKKSSTVCPSLLSTHGSPWLHFTLLPSKVLHTWIHSCLHPLVDLFCSGSFLVDRWESAVQRGMRGSYFEWI